VPFAKLTLRSNIQGPQSTIDGEGENNARTERTLSPVAVRFSKHKQPMMYLSRISKQTEIKKQIIEKKQKMTDLATTDKQFLMPAMQQIKLVKCNLTDEDFI